MWGNIQQASNKVEALAKRHRAHARGCRVLLYYYRCLDRFDAVSFDARGLATCAVDAPLNAWPSDNLESSLFETAKGHYVISRFYYIGEKLKKIFF